MKRRNFCLLAAVEVEDSGEKDVTRNEADIDGQKAVDEMKDDEGGDLDDCEPTEPFANFGHDDKNSLAKKPKRKGKK